MDSEFRKLSEALEKRGVKLEAYSEFLNQFFQKTMVPSSSHNPTILSPVSNDIDEQATINLSAPENPSQASLTLIENPFDVQSSAQQDTLIAPPMSQKALLSPLEKESSNAKKLYGQYEVLEELARGGMGIVLRLHKKYHHFEF